jgi:putative ABC transport system permease protein
MWTQALKSLRRAPGLAIAAILCLGLGASATSAVTTLVGALMLRPLPFPDADRLVRVWLEEPGTTPRVSLSIPELDDFAKVQAFDRFIGTARVRIVALFGGGAERLRGEGVSPHYFELLGGTAALGRLFADDDYAPADTPALVLSHGAWLRYYGGDPSVVGRELRSARAVYTIIGVTGPAFHGSIEDDVIDFYVPLAHYEPRALVTNRNSRATWAIARLAPGRSLADAQGEAAVIAETLAQQYPEIYRRYRAQVEPMGESWRQALRRGGRTLFAASVFLLLIAALNVGCLLLARVLDREREFAIRASLGADSRRLTAQLIAEALLLVGGGALVGLAGGPWLLEVLLRLSPVALPHYVRIAPDVTTVLLTVSALGVAGLVAGTAPAFVTRRIHPADAMRSASRGSTGSGAERRWTAILIGGETALTLVLLVAAGVLFRSFDRLNSVDLGFDREGIARLAITLNATDVGGPQNLPALYDRLHAAISAVPGAGRVGLVATTLPPWDSDRLSIRIDGSDLDVDGQGTSVSAHYADHGLFATLGINLVAGRTIASSDGPDAARVGIISASLARLLGGPERALGRTITVLPTPGTSVAREPFRVVGVSEDVAWDGLVEQDTRRYISLGDGDGSSIPRFDVYIPLAQAPAMLFSIGVRTTGDPASMLAPVRAAIGSMVPASAVHWTSTMEDELALEYAPSRFYSVIVSLFSLSALVLTSIGLFALLSHAASQRMREMGLRLALGATSVSTAALLMRTGLTPLTIGVIVGLGGAMATTRLMSGLLYGINRFDAVSFAGAVAALIGVSLLAAAIPARRVATVDPAVMLRGAD